jgi:hypothetical protein
MRLYPHRQPGTAPTVDPEANDRQIVNMRAQLCLMNARLGSLNDLVSMSPGARETGVLLAG